MEFKSLINKNSLAANFSFVNKLLNTKPFQGKTSTAFRRPFQSSLSKPAHSLAISRLFRSRSLRRGKFSISVWGKNKEAI
jgi:hypothetical protein